MSKVSNPFQDNILLVLTFRSILFADKKSSLTRKELNNEREIIAFMVFVTGITIIFPDILTKFHFFRHLLKFFDSSV